MNLTHLANWLHCCSGVPLPCNSHWLYMKGLLCHASSPSILTRCMFQSNRASRASSLTTTQCLNPLYIRNQWSSYKHLTNMWARYSKRGTTSDRQTDTHHFLATCLNDDFVRLVSRAHHVSFAFVFRTVRCARLAMYPIHTVTCANSCS